MNPDTLRVLKQQGGGWRVEGGGGGKGREGKSQFETAKM